MYRVWVFLCLMGTNAVFILICLDNMTWINIFRFWEIYFPFSFPFATTFIFNFIFAFDRTLSRYNLPINFFKLVIKNYNYLNFVIFFLELLYFVSFEIFKVRNAPRLFYCNMGTN